MEHLRTIAHLRPRTNTHQAMIRVRNALSWQVHKFFQDRSFQWIHTPILATSDAEGAGEMFQVTHGSDASAFFGQPMNLTVSGQLHVECFAQSHTDVYTFGPTFRAENSNTARHACEFWMIEPEIAFADLNDVIALAEEFIKVVGEATLEQCADDFSFFDRFVAKGAVQEVRDTLAKPFARITYAEAQEILAASGKSFTYPTGWGTSMQAEHERFLAEEHFKCPTIVYNYPKEIKSFYMKLNEDGKTVAAMDVLVPGVGELIGGSQREENYDVLTQKMETAGLPVEEYEWYLDLRKFGTVPHGGFGLGFERLIMFTTGIENIRETIPFPRWPGNAHG
jgi:asparaginyl-tRNA synthetase